MKNTKKIVALVLAIVLICAAAVVGTIAYLNSTTDTATNTFTIGDVKITLDEAKVDEYGVPVTPEKRVTANEYKLIPGHTYTKDPTIHVDKDSENCYVFVKVENDLENIESGTTIAAQIKAKGWTELTSNKGVYYKENVEAGENGVDLVIFDNFTIKSDATHDTLNECTTAKITVKGCAIQSDGVSLETATNEALKLLAD